MTRVDILEAINYAQEGRYSHVTWRDHLQAHHNGEPCEACTPEVIATAGDIETQEEWIRKYDFILAVLRGLL